MFSTYLDETIDRLLSKVFQEQAPGISDWFIVADSGSCRRAYFKMLENDIDIKLNERLEIVFNSLFNRRMKERQRNAHFIYCKHKMLLSDDWEKICRTKVFGRSNFFVLDGWKRFKCVKEELKEISELSKKDNSLIVVECIEFLKQQMN